MFNVKTLRGFVPPVVKPVFRDIYYKFKNKNILFSGSDELFKKYINQASVYGEYGCGASTVWVANHTSLPIIAVDTDETWVKNVLSDSQRQSGILIKYVDIGLTLEWGEPASYEKRDNFIKYRQSIWQENQQPDLILIDGRFRVSCFMHSLLKAKPNSIIIFDDYIARPKYHLVEEYIIPIETNNRQAVFKVPDSVDRELIQKVMNQFMYVVD